MPDCNQRYKRIVVPYFLPAVVPDTEVPGGYRYLGEDFAFQDRAKKCGYRIVADTKIRLQHMGRYAYQWEDAGRRLTRYPNYRLDVSASQVTDDQVDGEK